ncbi:MAG TPA: hypothetical protein VLX68_00970 [Chitinivibrionales bacterium]|nr:hypothetical protein [Chitinivibrionales bacterium]
MIKAANKTDGSFRDPSGFVFVNKGALYRQINGCYKEHYDYLIQSGLYRHLSENGLLVRHDEVNETFSTAKNAYKVLKPKEIAFISYPYEWCFSQLKAAAITTLEIQRIALEYGMTLKDSSAYNIQFADSKPIFIDTLSFEIYVPGEPWVAYRQFCEQFFCPLALMSFTDLRLNQLARVFINGIPLDLASKLLPKKTYLTFSLLSHIHLHAKSQRYFSNRKVYPHHFTMSKQSQTALLSHLTSSVRGMKSSGSQFSVWHSYYKDNNYSEKAFEHKKSIFNSFLDRISPKTLFDFGANTGIFSKISSDRGIITYSFDNDAQCIEKLYNECASENKRNILPLVMDLSNPSAGIGWANRERLSLGDRGPVDAISALALIHHLVISNNIPLEKIADFFSSLCAYLIIEFVPKSDSQVQRLLSNRKDVFEDYNEQCFEKSFSIYFNQIDKIHIVESERKMYVFAKR